MKPLIGLNVDYENVPPKTVSLYATYYEAILAAGGVPLLLPPMPENDIAELLNQLAGILLIGGDDYSPSRYNQEASSKLVLINPVRENFDFILINQLIKRRDMPVLGLCNGAQLMNIAFGGTLIQDIETEMPDSKVKHKGSEAGWKVKDWHEVQLEPDSRLFGIYKKERLNVPTFHHQNIGIIGKGLNCAAVADDGLPEALEAPDYQFFIGVQWHPERDLSVNEPLFKEFIAQAAVNSPH